jgi:SH3-like domain-containing protein
MLAARLLFLPVCLLQVVILLEGSCAQAAERRAVVAGAPMANVRVGAGVDHAIRATLKEGDQVSVGKLDGEWYAVTTADGQNGYIHRSLLSVGSEAQSPQTAQSADKNKIDKPAKEGIGTPAKPSQVAAGGAAKAQKLNAPEPAAAPKKSDAPAAKSPSIVEMLEGHENELIIAVAIASAFFLVGWICGGNHYLRRERKQRHKIRF